MVKKQKVHVKVGDQVSIIAGFYKKESGEILQINKKTGKVIVKGINLQLKHAKLTTENESNEFKALIHHSNLKVN